MGLTRKINYGSISNNQNGEVYSGAETWGELKSAEPVIGSLAVNMTAVVHTASGTQIKVTSDSQRLPESDFTIYFILEKNNSGGELTPEVAKMIEEFMTTVVKPAYSSLLETKPEEKIADIPF